ncbi:MAG: glucosamine-6-phosphate deaminase [Thermomicrobiales bacterium]
MTLVPDFPRSIRVDQLDVQIHVDRATLGVAAASVAAERITRAIRELGRARVAFAAAPSQNEFLAALALRPEIEWSRVVAFQLDEYVGLSGDAPQLFGRFLQSHLFDAVTPEQVHLIGTTTSQIEATARATEYAALLDSEPLDLVCLGIGENGHLAFNDPPVADFADPMRVKVVELDGPCRQQQVNDGCFSSLDEVPTHAITLTVPTLLSGEQLVCVVPGRTKRQAVNLTLTGPIAESCPASALRSHPACTLFVDTDSYGQ